MDYTEYKIKSIEWWERNNKRRMEYNDMMLDDMLETFGTGESKIVHSSESYKGTAERDYTDCKRREQKDMLGDKLNYEDAYL